MPFKANFFLKFWTYLIVDLFSTEQSLSKEYWSRGTVDWAQKLQTTNLVGLFCLQAGCWIPLFTIFILCSENSPNLTCYITLRVHVINVLSTVPSLVSKYIVLKSQYFKVQFWNKVNSRLKLSYLVVVLKEVQILYSLFLVNCYLLHVHT